MRQRTDTRKRGGWILVEMMALGLVGCGATLGTIPRATLVTPTDGFKMLRPGDSATRCRVEGVVTGQPDDLVGAAISDLVTRDPEADAVLHVTIDETSWSLGIYGRRCVTVTGDVVRSVRSVVLPMPESHGAHHHE